MIVVQKKAKYTWGNCGVCKRPTYRTYSQDFKVYVKKFGECVNPVCKDYMLTKEVKEVA